MKIRAFLVCGSFLAMLGAGAAVNLLTPDRTFSETENRYLQQLPSISAKEVFSGGFSSDFETYINDQFWNRDGWTGLKTLTGLALLKKDNGRVYFGRDGCLFEKTEAYDQKLLDRNIEAVKNFIRRTESSYPSLRCAVMLIPTASEIYPEKLPPYAPVPDQRNVIGKIEKAAGKETVIDPTDELAARKDKQLYYRTDHHWTSDGAYAAYIAWAEHMGLTPVPPDSWLDKTVSDNFRGTLYSKAGLRSLPPDSIKIYIPTEPNPCTVSWEGGGLDGLYDPSYLEKKDKYSYFIGGNHPLATVTTGIKNGKTLLLIKDSYANSMVPFLAEHYEKIILADPRYYKKSISELLEAEKTDDLLILYNVTGFAEDKNVAAGLAQ